MINEKVTVFFIGRMGACTTASGKTGSSMGKECFRKRIKLRDRVIGRMGRTQIGWIMSLMLIDELLHTNRSG